VMGDQHDASLMTRCPRFDSCSAPVCPLGNLSVGHGRGEPICPFLKEAVKPGGTAVLHRYLPEDLARAIQEAAPKVIALYGDIARRLRRASTQGSRMEQIERARHARHPLTSFSAPANACATTQTRTRVQ